jgi:hypothetical protein
MLPGDPMMLPSHLPTRCARTSNVLPAVVALLSLCGTMSAAGGPVMLITDRAAIAAVETLSWDATGKVFDPIAPNPADFLSPSFSVTTDRGLRLGVEIPAAAQPISPPLVFQTKSPPAGIPTNFAPGDYLLFTGAQIGPGTPFPAPGNPGPLSIRFDRPVYAAGAQVAVDDILSYDLTLDVYDAFDILLDSFTIAGTSSSALDDSAAFLGAATDSAIIAQIDFSSSESSSALGINELSLRHSVPEPPLALLAGLPMLILARRRRAKMA